MGCLSLIVNPLPCALLGAVAFMPASMQANAVAGAQLALPEVPKAVLSSIPSVSADLIISPSQAAVLTIGEVCSVSGGELTVLAATDGPLRTKDGGYILLDPEKE